MSKKNRSFNYIAVATVFAAVVGLAFAGNFGGLSFFEMVGSQSKASENSETFKSPMILTIGTCDTAGPIEIESTGGTMTPTAYATLKGGFDAINAGTHTGSINIEVCGNTTETATASLDASGSGSASYTDVTIRPVGGARIIEGTIIGAIVKLNGADNVTIDGRQGGTGTARDLTVRNNGNSTGSAAVWLSSVATDAGATNNVVRNLELGCGVTNTNTNSTYGIIMSGTTISTTSNGADNDNNQFVFNRITSARYGIVTRGVTTNNNISPIITDNIIGPNAFGPDGISKVGILLQADTGALVSRNTVQFIGGDLANTTAGADRVGIAVGTDSWSATSSTTITSGDYTVTRNSIHDVVEERTFSSVGILLGTTRSGSPTNNLVANNFIYNLRSNGTSGDQLAGIGISGGNGDKVIFNSISLSGDMDPGAAAATTTYGNAIRIPGANAANNANFTVANNSILLDASSSSTAANRYYAITLSGAAYSFGTGFLNNNNYFINGANPQVQTGGLGTNTGNSITTQFAALVDWQAALTAPQDVNSIQADPQYVANTSDLHIAMASPNVNAGVAAGGITTDFDGQLRVAAPDIGADEPDGLTPPMNDISATALVTPANGSTRGAGIAFTPQASYTNIGTNAQTSVTVRFKILDGMMAEVYNQTASIPSINPGASTTVDFPSATINTAGSYVTTASVELAGDENGANDSVSGTVSFLPPFSGSYNVGTSETFTSLTNAGGIFDSINSLGATGNVAINITSDLTAETGSVALNELPAGITVTIRPSGAPRTVSGSSTTAIIRINDADDVTIDGSLTGGIANAVGGNAAIRNLTIQNTSTTATAGATVAVFQGVNGAQNFTIKNVNVTGQDPTQTLVALHIGGNSVGASPTVSNNNSRVENCSFQKAILGIFNNGASAASPATGTVITQNDLSATGANRLRRAGIFFFNQNGIQVTENSIGGIDSNESVDAIGIIAGLQNVTSTTTTAGGVSNANISRNRISSVVSSSTVGFSAAGIAIAGDPAGSNTVANNMIAGVTAPSTSPDLVAGVFVAGVAGSNTKLYYNSVAMTGDRGAVASQMPSFGLAYTGDVALDLKDNIFYTTQISGGGANAKSYAIGTLATTFANLDSNYNDFWSTGANDGGFRSGSLAGGAGTDYADLAAWQAAVSDDTNSQEADPLFVSDLNDLHLQAMTPLENDGTPVIGITNDIDGNPRSMMAPEIGADELFVAVPGTLQFSSSLYLTNEGNPMVTLTVNRTGGTDGAVSVDFATANGLPPSLGSVGSATGGASCTAGIDYITTSGTLMFADGDTSKTFDVPLCEDSVFEGDEAFNASLSNVTGGASIGSPSTAAVTIQDNDVMACTTASPIEVISSGGTTVPTGYPTLKDSFDAINAGTHTGSINVNVCGNTTETATASIDASGVGSTSYTDVSVRPVGGQRIIEGTISGAVIKLNGADNVTIDGRVGGAGTSRDLTVRNFATTSPTAAVWLSSGTVADSGSTNNVIRNLEIATGTDSSASGSNTSIGIVMGGTFISATANGVDNDNNQFIFNRIIKARYGIVTRGTTTNLSLNTVVSDNIIGPTSFGSNQIGKTGILMQADTGATVSRNTVQFVGCLEPQACTGADRVGIGIGGESWSVTDSTTITSANYTVTDNVIHDVVDENTFSSIGIKLGTTQSGGATNNLVANNFIYNLRSNATSPDQVCGIGISGGNGDQIVNNSISITGDMDPGAATATTIFGNGIRIPTANGTNNANFVIQNNSIYMDASSSTPTVHFYPITLRDAAYAFGTGGLNYNNYYYNPANPQLFTGGLASVTGGAATTEFQTLANWQTALTVPQDANSIQADPLYFSNTSDLHIQQSSPNVDAGTTIAGIGADIDGQMRPNGANPDIGADEFYPASGAVQLSSSSYGVLETAGMQTITVVRTGGGNGAASVSYSTGGGTATAGGSCGGSVDYVTTSGTLNWADLDVAPKTFDVPICGDPVIEGSESFDVTLSSPVTVTLGTPSVATVNISNAGSTVGGPINVGTGETVASLTNPEGIFDVINNGVVTGNLTINITSDLTAETGAIALNEIPGGFTVLIKPSGAPRTISGTSGATSGLVGFNDVDNLTIDGSLSGGTDRSLTVNNLITTTAGGGIYFSSGTAGAQNNTVKNVKVYGAGATGGTLLGIAFGGNTFGSAGTDNDNNRIENNDIRGTFYGIASLGASAANKNTGTVITRNIMPGTDASGIGRNGIYVIFDDGAQITENNIASVTTGNAVDCIGIGAGAQTLGTTQVTPFDVTNALIARNYVGVVNNTTTSSSAGIVISSGPTGTNTVVNNMVTGVTGNADVGDLVAGIYVVPVAGATQNIYHNSVSMTGDRGTTANMFPSFALAISQDQPVNVFNNILVNSQTRTGATGGGGESYAFGFDGSAANLNLVSNYNDLFVSGPLGQIGITGDLTTPAQTTTAGTGTNRSTLGDWQTATGDDANSLNVDPMFVSLTDLHIQMGSPMVNAGTDVGVTTDFDGETRTFAPEVGADELPGAGNPGSLQFSNPTYSGNEDTGPFTVAVTRTGGSNGTVTVDYATSNGTATGGAACTAGVDYINNSGTLTFLNGETSKTFDVSICDDTNDEPDETINYTLTNPTGGATLGMPSSAVQTIVDNDPPAPAFVFTVSDVRVREGNTGTAFAVFNVTLTSNSTFSQVGGPLASVQYATADGTATSGIDYFGTSGTLNFNSTGTQTVSVPVNGDANKEANETLAINLSNPSPNSVISDAQGVAIIIDEDRAYVGDYDRDLVADYGIFRPSEGTWYILQSALATPKIVPFGTDGDVAVPGDYDADGLADIAVWRPSEGNWYVLPSSTAIIEIVHWGTSGDKPVQGDYDGDGKTDLAIFRPSTGTWWTIQSSTSNSTAIQFGISTDRPVQGDYDGDAKTDIAVYRDGVWYILKSSDTELQVGNWGTATDKPVSGDFDGDGSYDLAIYRNGDWWILSSLTGTARVENFGNSADVPAPADFDGDGTTDIVIFRPSTGDWHVLRSSDSVITGVHWGVATDVPIPSAYIPQ